MLACWIIGLPSFSFFFFFNDTATTEIYTLSLHDALPISGLRMTESIRLGFGALVFKKRDPSPLVEDRKSTRLNSSHGYISYAVFCLKKKKHYVHNYLLTRPTPGSRGVEFTQWPRPYSAVF